MTTNEIIQSEDQRRSKLERQGYAEICFGCGSSVLNCFAELIEAHVLRKCKCFGVFNGHFLLSDSMSIDSVLTEVIGRTWDEDVIYTENQRVEYEKHKEEVEKQCPAKIQAWIDSGKELISEELWEEWELIVPIRARDLYEGMELDAALALMKQLKNDGNFEKAKALIVDQDHSGSSFYLVMEILKKFSPRGEEFAKFVG